MYCFLCLFFYDVDVKFSHQHFGGYPGGLSVFSFPFFAIFTSWLLFILFSMIYSCLSPDSGLSHGILDLADVANIFLVIPQSIASDASYCKSIHD